MAVDKPRAGKMAMELMDALEKEYPGGEVEGLVICAAVRSHPSGGRQVRWVAEPANRELVRVALYSALSTVDEATETEGGPA
jgi:hypothetical protein